ncbi:DUF3986 family protein [Metabacillus niabensis]|uniref:DUF3986 family protein n=1 Tax=Metabacillus niabensis TaxID=324854 RepID=UPI001CFB4637|nr:DUF3986 family protein [Metabacillus niabensis]
MDILYDDRYHLHLGYYGNNFDYESIALKRKLEDVWDIFFDFKQYRLRDISPENELSLDGFGKRIFSIHNKELTYDIGAQKFEQWLSLHKII